MTFLFKIGATAAALDIDDARKIFGRALRLVSGGYVAVRLGSEERLLHRYLLGLGKGDCVEVDHINGIRADNRRSNLRLATRSENAANRRDVKGVYWDQKRERWCAHLAVNKKRLSLGRFVRHEEALAARLAAEDKHQGRFAARHGANRGD